MKNFNARHILLFFSFVISVVITLQPNLQVSYAAESADRKSPGSQIQSRESILTPEEQRLLPEHEGVNSKKFLYGAIGMFAAVLLVIFVSWSWNRRLRQEIKKREKAEAKIQEAHQRVLTIMDSIEALIYVADMDNYELLFVNKYGRDVWGDIIGKTCWLALQEGQTGPCEFCTNKYLLDPGGRPKGVYTWEFQNTVNKHWYYIHDKAIQWIDGRIVRLEIATDITGRKSAEEERERLNKELEQIISVISHDLRSPLVNIDGYSRDMETSAKELHSAVQRQDVPKDIKEKVDSIANKDMSESVRHISTSVYKMYSLLNGLLKLSRTGQIELEKEKLDMKVLVSNIADNFEFQTKEAGASIKISELPPCVGDRDQIDQVFSNLIGNALKCLDPERPGIITVSGNKEKDLIVYCVEDNGVGIAPENQEMIFGIFKQLDKGSSGEGLGLAIVKRIIERHSGRLRVESEPGKGSRFFVSLPVR
jgi:signal transduction histidine kinase